jgi:hypothetical protein
MENCAAANSVITVVRRNSRILIAATMTDRFGTIAPFRTTQTAGFTVTSVTIRPVLLAIRWPSTHFRKMKNGGNPTT